MLLDDALFGQITTSLSGEAPAQGGASTAVAGQRRREPRIGINARVTVIPISDSLRIMPFEVPVRDLSAGGIGFIHTDRIGLNDQFAVLLPQGDESVAVLCEVAHYQPLAERQYAIGARFVRVLRRTAPAAAATTTLPHPAATAAARRAAS
jgi:hypothetical protein